MVSRKKIIRIIIAILSVILFILVLKNIILHKTLQVYVEKGDSIKIKKYESFKEEDPSIAYVDGHKIIAKKDGDTVIKIKKNFLMSEEYLVKVRSIDKSEIAIAEGRTDRITTTLEEYKWSSSDENTVRISEDGVITAISPGKSTITCKGQGLHLQCQVYVPSVNKKKLSMKKTATEQLTIECTPYDSEFSSENPEIATVNNEGLVTAVAPGNTTINCKTGDIVMSVSVNVFSLNRNHITMGQGQVFHLEANTEDVKWSSDNMDIASINDKGEVTGVSPGTTKIHVTSGDVVLTCKVNVACMEKETYEKNALSDPFQPNVLHTDEEVSYTVENENVAVAENGMVYIRGLGSTTITAKTGECVLSCSLIVKVPDNIKTPMDALPKESVEERTVATIKSYPRSLSYTVYNQMGPLNQSGKFKNFISTNGSSACVMASVLSASGTEATPQHVVETIEREQMGDDWERNYKGSQQAMTLYGMSKVLSKYGIGTEYKQTYENDSAKQEIMKHLMKGNPVAIAIRDDDEEKWDASWHTALLLGVADDDKLILADSMDGKTFDKQGRIKYLSIDDVLSCMYSSEESGNTCYYQDKETAGGYLLIKVQEEIEN